MIPTDDKKPALILTVVFTLLFVLTFARWGTLIVDCFHDAYVANLMAEGKHLYLDVNYLYGPFVPWLYLVLFTVFGANLFTLYISGGLCALCFLLTFYFVARQILNIQDSLLTCALVIAVSLFSPVLKGFILPYTACATYGTTFSLLTLAFILWHYRTLKNKYLYFAGFTTVLTLLIKHEFALAAFLILAVYSIYLFVSKKTDYKFIVSNLAVVLAVPALIYALLAYYYGFETVQNILIPTDFIKAGSYFQDNFLNAGFSMLAFARGLKAFGIFCVVVALVFGVICGYLHFKTAHPKRVLAIFATLVLLFAVVLKFSPQAGVFIGGFFMAGFLKTFAGFNFFIPLILLSVYLCRYKLNNTFVVILLTFYSLFITLRTPFYTGLEAYGTYYLPVVFILFIYFLKTVLPLIFASKIPVKTFKAAANVVVVCLIAFYSFYDAGLYLRKTYVVNASEAGFIFAEPSYGEAYQKILDIINKSTSGKDKIFVIPEEVSYYFLSGRLSPSAFYYLNPAIVAPESEQQKLLLHDLESDPPELVVVSNLPRGEFGVDEPVKSYPELFEFISRAYSPYKILNTTYPLENGEFYKITVFKRK